MKKILSPILAAILLLTCLLPAGMVSAAETDNEKAALKQTVEQQIRAFAATFKQKDAVDNAASALAKHGLSGRGKTLKVGKTHPLTATLWSSELLQHILTECCTEAARMMQQADLSELPNARGTIGWYSSKQDYYLYTQTSPSLGIENWDWEIRFVNPYKGSLNNYDSALTWIAGSTILQLEMKRTTVTETEVTYRVTCTVSDSFDFNTVSNSNFKNLVSGLAALLFREFTWESTASFDLTVPYACSHTSGAYHWRYDPDSKTFVSDTGNGYTKNPMIRHEVLSGESTYYYELAETVRLYHNKPWVLEFDVQNPGKIGFYPFENAPSVTHPNLTVRASSIYFRFRDYSKIVSERITYEDLFGVKLSDPFTPDPSLLRTYRLENRVLPDGSNCVYLTVWNTDTGEILASSIPMDDYYRRALNTGLSAFVDGSTNGINGKDLHINFIGYPDSPFIADRFDLRIWENGKDGGKGDYFTESVTDPSCTSPGSVSRTCSLCGLIQTESLPTLEHTPGPEATCTENQSCTLCGTELSPATGHSAETIPGTSPGCEAVGSTEGSKCGRCGEILKAQEEIPALGHQYESGICVRCGGKDPSWIPGDANGDRAVNYEDALLILRYSIGLETLTPETLAACDVNHDGDINYSDALMILRASIGLETLA